MTSNRRYVMFEDNQHIKDFRSSIEYSNIHNNVDKYLGKSHDYTKDLFMSTDLNGFNDRTQIDLYKSKLAGTGSFNSIGNEYNPDFADNVNFDYAHPNALDSKWNKDQLHFPLGDNELKDHPYRGHPNLQVQPVSASKPSEIFNLNTDWVAAKDMGVLPQINPKTDGPYGTYDKTRNEISSSRESIGQYFTKVYKDDAGSSYKEPRNLGTSDIPQS